MRPHQNIDSDVSIPVAMSSTAGTLSGHAHTLTSSMSPREITQC